MKINIINMNLKEAVNKSIKYLNEVYNDLSIRNVMLEEIDSENDSWLITLSYQISAYNPLSPLSISTKYKTIKLDKNTGEVSESENYLKFGLTDSSILEISKPDYLVLTDDFKLYQKLSKTGIRTVNFNYLRMERFVN